MNDPLREFAPDVPGEGDIEGQLRAKLGEHDFLVDLWQMGQQMQDFADTTAGAYLVTTFSQGFNAAIRSLLELPDVATPEGRAAHAEARKFWALLKEIEETIGVGQQAERTIVLQDAEPKG